MKNITKLFIQPVLELINPDLPAKIIRPQTVSLFQTLYVKLLMDVMGRAFEAASQLDSVVKKELSSLKTGFLFEMSVMPDGPGLVLQKQHDGSFHYVGSVALAKPDLKIQIKHIAHAFLMLSFQESTAVAFANDRVVVDGDISIAMKIVRCLNRLETLILPRVIAKRALKRYPSITLREKTYHGARVYSRLATNFAKRITHV